MIKQQQMLVNSKHTCDSTKHAYQHNATNYSGCAALGKGQMGCN